VASSDGASPSPDATTSTPVCMTNADCDDHIACTLDECLRSSSRRVPCAHSVQPSRCAGGETCDARRGCVPGHACAADGDCMDSDPCTVRERCDLGARVCIYDLLDGDGDGELPRSCGGRDCNDSDGTIYPGNVERCNGRDDNCDERVDESPSDCGRGTVCRGEGASARCVCAQTEVRGAFQRCSLGGATLICTDVRSDDQACGENCRRCPEGARCVGGQCTCTQPGRAYCDATIKPSREAGCFDFQSSNENCGQCNFRCPVGSACRGGTCSCPSGLVACRGSMPGAVFCADLMTDRANCGACGNACPDVLPCMGGVCACSPGQTACMMMTSGPRPQPYLGCVDVRTDTRHCGACGNACNFDERCAGGRCQL
jgi:hypothetical protein